MLDELNANDVESANDQPPRDAHVLDVDPSLQQPEAFDVGTATKAAVARALPAWHAERQRLNRYRIRQRDTTREDRLVVGFVRKAGIVAACVVAVAAAWVAYEAGGPLAGLAAGALGLAVALASASAGVIVARALFDRSERVRRETVAELDRAIRRLDVRMSKAFLVHGLTRRTRTRTSF